MRFKKPTIQEVKEAFFEKGVKDYKQTQLFMAHYESNGWYVGKTKMKSWRAAVAGWCLRMPDFNQQPDDPSSMRARSVNKTPLEREEERLIAEGYERLKREAEAIREREND